MISLITSGPMRGPLFADPNVVEIMGYNSPVSSGQRPRDSPFRAPPNVT